MSSTTKEVEAVHVNFDAGTASNGAAVVVNSSLGSTPSLGPVSPMEKKRSLGGDTKQKFVELPKEFTGAANLPVPDMLKNVSSVTLPSRLDLLGRRYGLGCWLKEVEAPASHSSYLM
jgi:hypothetical protein